MCATSAAAGSAETSPPWRARALPEELILTLSSRAEEKSGIRRWRGAVGDFECCGAEIEKKNRYLLNEWLMLS